MLDRERLGELFERALDVAPSERAAFIDAACAGDEEVRAELASLLASHAAAPDFLDGLAGRVLPGILDGCTDPVRPGSVIGRYRILGRLGRGGMGVVYKAWDESLDRPVALKFLAPDRATDATARALLRSEARAASALNHPNIAVVHEIGVLEPARDEPCCGLFIVMAHYEGETLRQVIERGPMRPVDALDCAIQVAEGLSRAHEAGIVHRDIKPANVMLTGRGHVRILDFGVAARLTGTNAAAGGAGPGTRAYMSPEQASGRAVDHRTDLWSLGVMLYEMLTGVHPPADDAGRALRHRISPADPEPVHAPRPHLPSGVQDVLRRCLATDPAARYASAEQLLADLRRVRAAAASTDPDRAAILVLPFADLSPCGDSAYFSDGLTEEVITTLSQMRAVRVISRTSSMRLKGRTADVLDIAREVGVRYVLEGAVRKAGDVLRITATLVDARRDGALWTHRFDGTVADVFAIQEQVAQAVADALRIRVSAAETLALSARPIPDARAYDSYLRARYEAWRFTTDGLQRATHYIETALSIVGDNELLLSTLGHIMAMHLEAGVLTETAPLERVDALADRVFALNPQAPRGHWLKAFVAFQRGDLRSAMRSAERALALAPEEPDTLLLLGYVYTHAGRNEDAQRLLTRAVLVDPLTPLTRCMPGFVAVMEGRFTDAIDAYRRQHLMDPDSPFAIVTLGWVLAYARRFEEAVRMLAEAGDRFPETPFGGWARSLAASLGGDRSAAARAITPAFEAAARGSEMFARALAQCWTLAGQKERALDWLEHAVRLGMLNHAFLARHDWFLDGLRDEPRFRRLLERVREAAAELASS